jgi:hypothetical protein
VGTKYGSGPTTGKGVITEDPASLRECFGFNSSIELAVAPVPVIGLRFFQLFNQSTEPVDDDVPLISVSVPGLAQFTIDFEQILYDFPDGMAFGFSEAPDKFLASSGVATSGWVNVIYESTS